MKIKKLLALMLIFCMFAMSGCIKQPQKSNKDVKVIKIGHAQNETHVLHKGLKKFKELVERNSHGSIHVDIYSSGGLGSDAEVVQQVRMGDCDAVATGLLFLQGEFPQVSIDEIPFLFESAEHVYSAYDGELGRLLDKEVFEPAGLIALGAWGLGLRHFTNNIRPITTIKDMADIKFRTAESAIRIAMFNAFGAKAIPLSQSELFTALQQGAVEGQENPLATIQASSYYEVQKYLSLSGHIFTTAFIMMNRDIYSKFTNEERKNIDEAMKEATVYARKENSTEETLLLKKLQEEGMRVNEIERESFVESVKPIWDSYIESYGSEWFDAVQRAKEGAL